MNNQISVVVAVYNAQDKIERCIQSIVNQTYQRLEIILVDDGSQDNSFQICKNWEKQDKRIKVLSKPNGGVSSARNHGIAYATGEWITFVDSDDYIDEFMYEKMINIMLNKNADMIVCGKYNICGEKTVEEMHAFGEEETLKQEEIYTRLLVPLLTPNHKNATLLQPVWNKLYSISEIKENRIMFDEKLRYAEDWLFNIVYLVKAKCVVFTKGSYYYYNNSSTGSLSGTWRVDCFEDEIHILNELKKIVPDFYKNKDVNEIILQTQCACLKNFVYFNGMKGFERYATRLFYNEILRESYLKFNCISKRFINAQKAMSNNDINKYISWARKQVFQTKIKYNIKSCIRFIKKICSNM